MHIIDFFSIFLGGGKMELAIISLLELHLLSTKSATTSKTD